MIACVIASGGSGKRFSGKLDTLPKQYHKIQGESMLHKVIRSFGNFPTVVSIRAEDIEYFKKNYNKVLYVTGGKTRQESVKNGLFFLKEHFPEIKYVLITDAARPFVTKTLIQKIIQELISGEKAVIPVLKIVDTLKEIKEGYIIKTKPRNSIVRAQTPQGFDFEIIHRLHIKFSGNEFTDDSALFEKEGIKVKIIEGEPDNIKITFPEDIIQ